MNKHLTSAELPTRQYRFILAILFFEICIYFFCNIHLTSFQQNTFVAFEQDPLLWLVYFSGLPQLILSSSFLSYFIDVLILLLLITLIYRPLKKWVAILLLIALFIFYCIFTTHLGHRNYQSGYLFVLIPFLFAKTKNKQIAFELTRYFLLFFYVSAAFFKFKSGSLFVSDHFSHEVVNQFTPYFLEHSYSIRTDFNLYLITHHSFAKLLYCGATFLEFIVVIGFFTKRFDTYLGIIILIFHFANWFIMDIAPVGQIAFICTLFFSQKFCWQNQF